MKTDFDSMPSGHQTLRVYDFEFSDHQVAAVSMLLKSPVNHEKVIVIVEGHDDVDAYSAFFRNATTEFFPDGNCEKHAIILNQLNEKYSDRLLAIKDADFDHINSKSYSIQNLFLTDEHDMEGMVLKDGMPQSVVDKYPKRCGNICVEDVRKDIISVSYLRWMNNVSDIHLPFNSVRIYNYYHPSHTTKLDFDNYLNDLWTNYGTGTGKITFDVLKSSFNQFVEDNGGVDLGQLTRGHDLMECLYVIADSNGTHNFPKKKFFKEIRGSYSSDSFSRTRLCASIYACNKLLMNVTPSTADRNGVVNH